MIAVDTNILVRHLMADDPVQSPLATEFLEVRLTRQNPGLISVVVLCELAWTLKRVYGRSDTDVNMVIEELLAAPTIVVDHSELVSLAIVAEPSFSDALIHLIGTASGCDKTVTFDKRFARSSGVELLE